MAQLLGWAASSRRVSNAYFLQLPDLRPLPSASAPVNFFFPSSLPQNLPFQLATPTTAALSLLSTSSDFVALTQPSPPLYSPTLVAGHTPGARWPLEAGFPRRAPKAKRKMISLTCLRTLHLPLRTMCERSPLARRRGERVMRKWNRYLTVLPPQSLDAANFKNTIPDLIAFFNEDSAKNQIDPDGIWFGMCCDDEKAKMHCKIFLHWYVKCSGRLEVCLGPAEREWSREVKPAITVTEVWKCLVVEADSSVLFRKWKDDRANRRRWILSFAKKDRTGPVAEISRMFVKQETTAEDIAVFLDTLWTRSEDIPLTPTKCCAFHAYVLMVGIGGFRNSSLLGLPYRQVRFALVRTPDNPESSTLTAHVLIIQPLSNVDTALKSDLEFLPGNSSSEATVGSASVGSKPDIKPLLATCLICLEACANRCSLTRHHKRHHLRISFRQPFPCPECQRQELGDFMIDGAPAWSSHVETYHGRDNAPKLPGETQLWHESVVAVPQEAYCLICCKSFLPGKGFASHLRNHKNEGTFSRPFHYKLSTENISIGGLPAWIDHSVRSHAGYSHSGAVLGKFTVILERAHDDDLPARKVKIWKVETGQGDSAVKAVKVVEHVRFEDDTSIVSALYDG